MGEISNKANQVYRDGTGAGHFPVKREIRDLFRIVDQGVQGVAAAIQAAQEADGVAAVAGALAGYQAGTEAAFVAFDLFSDSLSLRRLGFIGDGESHTLASVDPEKTLADWQEIYPPNSNTGGLGALSLDDQIDGLAIQKALDTQVSLLGRFGIEYPAADAFTSRPIRTNGLAPGTCRGMGGNGTSRLTLLFANDEDSIWEHGLDTPAGSLCFEGMTLRGASSAYAVKIDSDFDFSFFMKYNWVSGFEGFIDGFNCKSSLSVGNVVSTSGAPSARAKDAYLLTHDQPCFQIYIADKQILGFDSAVRVIESSAPGIEGVYLLFTQINECNHPFILNNTVMTVDAFGDATPYYAPDFKLFGCEIETYQSVLGLWGYCQGLDTCNNYIITLGTALVDKGAHYNGAQRAKVKDNRLNIVANHFTHLFEFENTESCEMSGNDIVDELRPGKTYTSAFLWLTGSNPGFREYDTTLDASSGLSVGGAQAGLVIEMVARFAVTPGTGISVSMDQSGRYTYVGYAAGTISGSGQLTAALPTRPDGTPLFTSTSLFVRCSHGDQAFMGPGGIGGSAPLDMVAPVNPINPSVSNQIIFQWRRVTDGVAATTGIRQVNFEVTSI